MFRYSTIWRQKSGDTCFALRMLNLTKQIIKKDTRTPILSFIRNAVPYIERRKRDPVDVHKTLEERLAGKCKIDPEISFKVDIGLPPRATPAKVIKERKKFLKARKEDPELEKKSRTLMLCLDTNEIREEWLKTDAPAHIQRVAEHFNLFNDLFGDAYFTPYVILNVHYPQENSDLVAPVCWGNIVKPSEAFSQPLVNFESKPDELWTLSLVSPDGHFTKNDTEYVHWLVGNIPGSDVSKGETLWDYLPPFPPRGLGFQRFVFVLYKQDKRIDYSSLKKELPCLELEERSFKTLEFYRERQDEMTPAGLAFFQSDWDKTSKKVYHEILQMEEPVFEYDHPEKVLNKQKKFPKGESFNMYLDKYRDPRDIAKEYILKKLKEVNPLEPPKKPFPYPKAIRSDFWSMPSWLKKKEQYYRTGRGRVTQIQRDEYE